MDNETIGIIRDLDYYLRIEKLPFEYTIQIAKFLFKKTFSNCDDLQDVSDNDELLYYFHNKFRYKNLEYNSIKVSKNGQDSFHSISDIITEDSICGFKVYIKVEDTEITVSEKNSKFPSAGIEILNEEEINQGDIFGNDKYVIVFTEICEGRLKGYAIELTNKSSGTEHETSKCREFELTDEFNSIGRTILQIPNQTISKENNYSIFRYEKNKFKIQKGPKLPLIKFFHNAYTLNQTDSQSEKTSKFWFCGSIYRLSLVSRLNS